MKRIEIVILLDGDGNNAIGSDLDEAKKYYGDNIGDVEDAEFLRVIQLVVNADVPGPTVVDIQVPQAPAATLASVDSNECVLIPPPRT